MQTTTTHHIDASTPVSGYILDVNGKRVMYLQIGENSERSTFILFDPTFLDRLSNEADRLCREYVEGERLVIGGTSAVTLPPVFHDGPDKA